MRIKLEVAEPWDFSSQDGDNVLVVESVTEGHGKYGDRIICTCKPFRLNGAYISSLLLSKRHTNHLLDELRGKKAVQMNVYWRKNGENWTEESAVDAETNSSLIGGFLIASGKVIEN